MLNINKINWDSEQSWNHQEKIWNASNEIKGEVLLITQNAWIEQIRKKRKEIIEWDDALNDLFYVNENWDIEIKNDSTILKWHFPWDPLSPGVLLKKLYSAITWIDLNNPNKEITFSNIIIPWDVIKIEWDKITSNWQDVLSIKTVDDKIPDFTENENHKDWHISPISNPSSFLLQWYPILLAEKGLVYWQTTWKINVWDKIFWKIKTIYVDDNRNLDPDFLTEGAAQVLSACFSFIQNKWKTLKEKGWDFSTMTFKKLRVENYNIPKFKEKENLLIESQIIKKEWNTIEVYYVIKDKKWKLIQRWIIEWKKNSVKVINFLLRKNIIKKIEGIINDEDLWLNSFFILNKNSWILTVSYENLNTNLLLNLIQEFSGAGVDGPIEVLANKLPKLKKWDQIEIRNNWLYFAGKNILNCLNDKE